MSWPEARTTLRAAIGALPEVERVLATPPRSGSAAMRSGVTVVMLPPARTSERTPGRTSKVYTVEMAVGAPMSSDPERAAELVDAAVEAIDATLEQHILLGGAVTSVSAASWEGAGVQDGPPGSKVMFVVSVGTVRVTIVTCPARGA